MQPATLYAAYVSMLFGGVVSFLPDKTLLESQCSGTLLSVWPPGKEVRVASYREPLLGPYSQAGKNILWYLLHGSDGCYLKLGEGGSPLRVFDSTENSGESEHVDVPILFVSILCVRSWVGMGWKSRTQSFTHA